MNEIIAALHYKDLKSRVYLKPSRVVKQLVKTVIEKLGQVGVEKLSGKTSYSPYWQSGKYKLSLDTFFEFCKFLNLDPFEKLENQILLGRKGKGSIVFSKSLIERLAPIDATIRGDGHIYDSGLIGIYQNDRTFLENIGKLLDKLTLERCWKIYSQKSRKLLTLYITSRPLAWVLVNLMKNPIGKKPYELSLPPQFDEWNKTRKLEWLSFIYVSEGTFTFHKIPRISIKMSSTLPIRIKEILEELSYHPVLYQLSNKDWTVNINRYIECAKFCQEIYEFVGSAYKKNQITNLLSNKQFLEGLRLKVPELVKKAVKRAGSQSKLAKLISSELNYNLVRESVRDWVTHPNGVRLRIVVFLAKYLELPIFDVVPKELGLLLYKQSGINKFKLKDMKTGKQRELALKKVISLLKL